MLNGVTGNQDPKVLWVMVAGLVFLTSAPLIAAQAKSISNDSEKDASDPVESSTL